MTPGLKGLDRAPQQAKSRLRFRDKRIEATKESNILCPTLPIRSTHTKPTKVS